MCFHPLKRNNKYLYRRKRTKKGERKNATKYLIKLGIKRIRQRSSETVESNGAIMVAGRGRCKINKGTSLAIIANT